MLLTGFRGAAPDTGAQMFRLQGSGVEASQPPGLWCFVGARSTLTHRLSWW